MARHLSLTTCQQFQDHLGELARYREYYGTTENYTYDDADKLDEIKVGGVTVKSYGYDTAGRTTSVVTSGGTTTLAYDYESRISTITYPSTATNTFTYNGLDTRVGKVDSAGTATYKRDGAAVTAPVLTDGSATYTPGISERRSSTSTWFHSGIKNAVEQTSSTPASTATRVYDAFGNVASSTGTWKSPFGYAGDFGYQEDGDSGLKLLGHRYYDSSIGRFLTRDRAKNGRNIYLYCDNSPTHAVDSDGLEKIKLPGSPKGLLDKGWTQDPQHGGKKRVPGGDGAYWPPGVKGTEVGDEGIEFHEGNKDRNQGPHFHKVKIGPNGRMEKEDDHLDPGEEVDVKNFIETPRGKRIIRGYAIPPILPGGLLDGLRRWIPRLIPRLIPRWR